MNRLVIISLLLVALFGCNSENFPDNVKNALVQEGFTNVKYELISKDIYHFAVGYPEITFEITNSERNQGRLYTDNKYAKRRYTGVMHVNNKYYLTTDNRLLGKPKWNAIVRALNKHLH